MLETKTHTIASLYSRCFPHIVNLACTAVLAAITALKYAEEDADDYDPNDDNVLHLLDRDPIATLRSLIRAACVFIFWLLSFTDSYLKIRASSLRRQHLSKILTNLQQDDLQLLRDVVTRWSSTLLMIGRGLQLREVCLILSILLMRN